MGFVTGFTGGVTLTLSAAYLLALTHQRNREQQSAVLRAQTLAIADLVDPVHPPLPPSRSELAAAERAHSLEAVKDRWNTEVENAVRWVQHTDWTEVRETAEATASRFLRKAFSEEGKEPLSSLEQAALSKAEHSEGLSETARAAYEEAKRKEHQAEAAASSFWRKAWSEEGKEPLSSLEQAALSKAEHSEGLSETARAAYEEAKHKEQQAASALSRTASAAKKEIKTDASEAKGWLSSAVEKGRDLVSTATATTGLADVELTTDGTTPALGVTPVQKALQQRYQRPEAKNNKTVADVLKERYMPVDRRDNTVLRGV